MKDIYLINVEKLLGNDHDASTDGIHPNDLVFFRIAKELKPQIRKILAEYHIR